MPDIRSIADAIAATLIEAQGQERQLALGAAS